MRLEFVAALPPPAVKSFGPLTPLLAWKTAAGVEDVDDPPARDLAHFDVRGRLLEAARTRLRMQDHLELG
jgi:hypothetical protein